MGGVKRPSDTGVSNRVVELPIEVPAKTSQRQIRSDTSNRTWRERGAALIEMALVAPLLVMMVFGIIDFGSVLSNYQELRSAVREGGRMAAVNNGCPDTANPNCAGDKVAQLAAFKDATRARATGVPLADQSNITIEVCFMGGASGLPLPPGATPAVGRDNVRVTLSYPASSFTGLFGGLLNSIILTTKSEFRLEKAPTYGKDC